MPITLACVLALAGLACPAYAAVAVAAATAATALPQRAHAPRDEGARAFGSGALIALEEQSLPPEDLPSPAASPAASLAAPSGSPSPSAASDNSGPGAQAPAGQPAAQAPAQPPATDEGAGGTQPPATDGGASASGASESGAATGAPAVPAGAPVAGEPSPAATPTDAPAPYDVGSIQPTAPVSDQPLTVLIASTKNQPALNASLRFAEQGRKSLESSKPDDAIRELGQAISIDPTDPYAYFYLGRAYMMKKDEQQALAFFGRSEVGLRTVPAWLGEVKSFEGACLEEQGKFPAAAAAYKEALDAAPGNLMARTGYGRLSESLPQAHADNAAPNGDNAAPNADNGGALPPPLDGAALPAPDVNLAAPAPAEAPPSAAPAAQSDSGADSGADSDADPDADSNADSDTAADKDSGAQGNQ